MVIIHIFRVFKFKFLVMANGKSVSLYVFMCLRTLNMHTTKKFYIGTLAWEAVSGDASRKDVIIKSVNKVLM